MRLPYRTSTKGIGTKTIVRQPSNGRSPANAQVVEHGTRKEREASRKHGSHEIVASKDRSGIFGISVRQIAEKMQLKIRQPPTEKTTVEMMGQIQ
jgi:hypothetical protein